MPGAGGTVKVTTTEKRNDETVLLLWHHQNSAPQRDRRPTWSRAHTTVILIQVSRSRHWDTTCGALYQHETMIITVPNLCVMQWRVRTAVRQRWQWCPDDTNNSTATMVASAAWDAASCVDASGDDDTRSELQREYYDRSRHMCTVRGDPYMNNQASNETYGGSGVRPMQSCKGNNHCASTVLVSSPSMLPILGCVPPVPQTQIH